MKACFEKKSCNFSGEMEITLYGFIGERRVMGPQDFTKKGKNGLKLPHPEVCIWFKYSAQWSHVTKYFSVYVFKSKVQMERNNPLIIFADHYND